MPLFRRNNPTRVTKKFVERLPERDSPDYSPSSTMFGLVIGSTNETTTLIDLKSKALVRWRIPWPAGVQSDLEVFDVVEAELAEDIEHDDLAQVEAVTVEGLPRRIGTYRTRRVRRWFEDLQAPLDGPIFGFRGPSAPYWEFRGERPSIALVAAQRGPQLLRRLDDGSTWVRFGWGGDDVWLVCEDAQAIRAIEATRREALAGKDLATALGFRPAYVLTTLSQPIDGHCYKICTGLLPRG
jgi:hypothetical protein